MIYKVLKNVYANIPHPDLKGHLVEAGLMLDIITDEYYGTGCFIPLPNGESEWLSLKDIQSNTNWFQLCETE